MNSLDDRRRLRRLSFAVPVRLHTRHGLQQGTSRDICMTGMLVTGVQQLPLGTRCQLELVLTSGLEEVTVRGQGEVVRHLPPTPTGEPGLGLRLFDLDETSQEYLWQVIRRNSAPPAGGSVSTAGAG
jgi:hypothetical protein